MKAPESWNVRAVTNCSKWETFFIVIVVEYERMLASGVGKKCSRKAMEWNPVPRKRWSIVNHLQKSS